MIRKVNKKEKIETAGIIILCLYAILFSALFINTSLDIKDFTGFVVGGIKENIADSLLNPDETYGDISANLTIIDDTDIKVKALNEEVKFYARYVDINTGKAIKDALCTIYFYDINNYYTLQFNDASQLYEYARRFGNKGLYYWNATCTKINLTSLTAKDVAVIGSISGAYKGTLTDFCVEEWECTDWGVCLLNGVQYRECFDLNRCDDLYDKNIILHIDRSNKPFHMRSCIYQPTCDDMMINNNESDVDCGGPCPKCEDGKICRTDDDCINKCDLTIRRCYTHIEEVPEPLVEAPKPRLISISILIAAVIILLITILTTYRYQGELVHRGVEYYKERTEISEIRRKTRIKSEIARKASKERLKKLEEERKLELRRIKERVKLEKTKEIKEAEEKAVHDREREKYTEQLSTFFTESVKQGYTEDQIKDLLIKRGWPEKIVAKYSDTFFEKEQKLISKIREQILRKEKLSQEEARRMISKIKEKERLTKRRLKKLEDELLQIDKKIAGK